MKTFQIEGTFYKSVSTRQAVKAIISGQETLCVFEDRGMAVVIDTPEEAAVLGSKPGHTLAIKIGRIDCYHRLRRIEQRQIEALVSLGADPVQALKVTRRNMLLFTQEQEILSLEFVCMDYVCTENGIESVVDYKTFTNEYGQFLEPVLATK